MIPELGDIKGRIVGIEKSLTEMQTDMKVMNGRLDQMDKRFEQIDRKLEELHAEMDRKFEELHADVRELRSYVFTSKMGGAAYQVKEK